MVKNVFRRCLERFQWQAGYVLKVEYLEMYINKVKAEGLDASEWKSRRHVYVGLDASEGESHRHVYIGLDASEGESNRHVSAGLGASEWESRRHISIQWTVNGLCLPQACHLLYPTS